LTANPVTCPCRRQFIPAIASRLQSDARRRKTKSFLRPQKGQQAKGQQAKG
jgi:hypothetical protein